MPLLTKLMLLRLIFQVCISSCFANWHSEHSSEPESNQPFIFNSLESYILWKEILTVNYIFQVKVSLRRRSFNLLKNTFLLRQLCFVGFISAREERLRPLTPPLSVLLAYVECIRASARAGYSLPCCLVSHASSSSICSAIQSSVSSGLSYKQYLNSALFLHPNVYPCGEAHWEKQTLLNYWCTTQLMCWDQNLKGLL